MAFIDEHGRLLGRFNVIDTVMALGVVLAVGALLLVQSGAHQTSSAMIEGDAVIEYTVHLSHVDALHPEQWFKAREPVDLTVRNQPRGHVDVVAYTFTPRRAIIPVSAGKFVLVDDPNAPNTVEMYVTLRDNVQATKDGYVGNGVKLKQGSHVVLENDLTRLDGVISDVRDVTAASQSNSVAAETNE